MWNSDLTTIRMMEVQPQLPRLLRQGITAVRFGRGITPVVVLVSNPNYMLWRTTVLKSASCMLEEAERSISEVEKLFLSYARRVAPLLSSSDDSVVHVIVVKVHDWPVGAVILWKDWSRFPLTDDAEASVAESGANASPQERTLPVAAASRRLAELAKQAEEGEGMFSPVVITRKGTPVLAIVSYETFLKEI